MISLAKHRKIIILLVDILCVIVASILMIFLFFVQDVGPQYNLYIYLLQFGVLILCTLLSQTILKNYDNMWRYARCDEYIRLMVTIAFGYVMFGLINKLLQQQIPMSIIVGTCSLSMVFSLMTRFMYHRYLNSINGECKEKLKVVILGAGSGGVSLLEEIEKNPESEYEVMCFFDDDKAKWGKKIHGIKVQGPILEFKDFYAIAKVDEVILAIPSLSDLRKSEISNYILKFGIPFKILPDLFSILQDCQHGLLGAMKDYPIDHLLERETVSFDRNDIDNFIHDKVVMVTGGGGSIGSELCRQLTQSNPRKLIIVDNYENGAYEIQQEILMQTNHDLEVIIEIASIQDKEKIYQLFQQYQPEVVFHSAAHKHVPLMERNPEEAIKNNVFGTYNLINAANLWKTKKFVLISTDKAVNPTSIMGATKRICEMMIQSMSSISDTEYVAVRFGNVLGSNGSVLPIFEKQIKQGGPVTITDQRACRYFMTIPEASQLVLKAGAMASRSEIYVLDMGKPINILTLAENYIRLMGYEPYKEIAIKETGLRPGEKITEELLMTDAELYHTKDKRIMIEKQKNILPEEINEIITKLKFAVLSKDADVVRKTIIEVVPTFQSHP